MLSEDFPALLAGLNGSAEVGVITAGRFTRLPGLGGEDQSDQGAW